MGGRAASERWRLAYPEKARAIRRKAAKVWRANHPAAAKAANRAKHLLKKYGLTPGEWDCIFNLQGHRCAACGVAHAKWVTDHNHITGRVRAILCLQCNTDLGLLENKVRVALLTAYLEKFA